jgi:hypothetical protein
MYREPVAVHIILCYGEPMVILTVSLYGGPIVLPTILCYGKPVVMLAVSLCDGPMVVLTIFTIVEYILSVFSPPHHIRFWVPCRLAHECDVSGLSNYHICTGVPVHYAGWNCKMSKKF